MENCQIQIGEKCFSYPKGSSYEKIAQDFQAEYQEQILLVLVNGKLQELRKTVAEDCKMEFVTRKHRVGHQTYKRSMCLLLVKSIYDVCGHDNVKNVGIHFSIGDGYYCTVDGNADLNEELLEKVEQRMQELVEKDLPIEKKTVHIDEAVKRFRSYGMYDKERLFAYRRVSKVNLYSINEFEDYYYGYMVPRTGYLKQFRLHLYQDGFVLQMPKRENPDVLAPFEPREKLFHTLLESEKWGAQQGIRTVGELNDEITKKDYRELVLVQEAMQESQIGKMAEYIASHDNIKFILVAGPSSSGKTTFSHRLSIQLKARGKVPHPIAVDNYFVEREMTPKDENGEYDFECLETVDVELFQKQMTELLEGKEVFLPTFNFKTGHKEYNDPAKKLGESDILVIEGIHCLNPKLTDNLPKENKCKIYISALTQLNVDEHNPIATTDGRLIRRIVRDARTRATNAKQTIKMWESVRRGEERNIFPYQEEADLMFNSSLIYELSILKQYVEPLLFGIEKDSPEYVEAKRLLKFLDYFVGIGSEIVPANSLLREFVGGGCFHV